MRYRIWPEVLNLLPLLSSTRPRGVTIICYIRVCQLKAVSKNVMVYPGRFYGSFMTQVIKRLNNNLIVPSLVKARITKRQALFTWITIMAKSRIEVDICLQSPGKRAGDALMRWSDNVNPLGVYPVPIACIVGKPGPTALLVAGIHGDEFEGPVALSRLIEGITPDQITGRLIILPSFNCPAVIASQRVSPLDGRNMNRTFRVILMAGQPTCWPIFWCLFCYLKLIS